MGSDESPWLCRSETSWSLFWPFLLISSGLGSVVMNAINSYMFMNRLSKFVRLRLEGDDTFIAFYGVNSSKIHVRAESSRLSGLSNHSGHSGRASPERGGRASPERGGRASP